MNNPVIKKVANGYYVHPDCPSTKGVDDEEVFVFESFQALVKQLSKWLESEKGGKK